MPGERGGHNPDEGSSLDNLSFRDRVDDRIISYVARHETPKMPFRHKAAAVLLLVLAAAGLTYAREGNEVSVKPVDPTEQEHNKDKNIELDSLKVGEEVSYYDGTISIDTSKLHIRTSPMVVEEKGDGSSNRVELSGSGDSQLIVVNPALVGPYWKNVNVESDPNGTWYTAATGDGREIYFVGDRGGITNVETGAPVSLDATSVYASGASDANKAEVIATTTAGVAGRDAAGEEILLATVTG